METKTVGKEVRTTDEPLRIRTWQETIQREEHKKPMNERVDAMTYIKPFPIKECDLLTIKRFIQFCRFNSKNDWGVGLKMLMDYVETDAKTLLLYDKILKLENDMEGLKVLVDNKQGEDEEKGERKTFGGRK